MKQNNLTNTWSNKQSGRITKIRWWWWFILTFRWLFSGSIHM